MCTYTHLILAFSLHILPSIYGLESTVGFPTKIQNVYMGLPMIPYPIMYYGCVQIDLTVRPRPKKTDLIMYCRFVFNPWLL